MLLEPVRRAFAPPRLGEEAGLAVFDLGGRKWITKDDHERISKAVISFAREFGPPVSVLVAEALASGAPAREGAATTVKHFGKEMPTVQRLVAPLMTTLGEMIPGFVPWLEITGFGNDKAFAVACLKWAEVLAAPRQVHPTANRATSRLLKIA